MPMGFVIDESGTSGSTHEPVCVVAAVGIPTPNVKRAHDTIDMIVAKTVPKHLREGFIFHAGELTRRGAYPEDEWKFKDRLQTVHGMMAASSTLGGILVWSAVRAALKAGPLRAPGISMSEGENHHLIAFRNCLGMLNLYLADKNDQGGVMVEKSERMSRRLNALAIKMSRDPFPLTITALTSPD